MNQFSRRIFLSNMGAPIRKILCTRSNVDVVVRLAALESPKPCSFHAKHSIVNRHFLLDRRWNCCGINSVTLINKAVGVPVPCRWSSTSNQANNKNINDKPTTERDRIVTIPNALSVGRIAMAPVISYLVIQSSYSPALGLFVLAGISDVIDGYIARHIPNQSSVVGSALDPLADKVLIASLFLSLTYAAQIPLPLTCLVIARDVLLVLYSMSVRWRTLEEPRTWNRYWNPNVSTVKVKPTDISKVNTGLQLLCSALTLLAAAVDAPYHVALQVVWGATALTTVWSGLSYVWSHNTIEYLRTRKRL